MTQDLQIISDGTASETKVVVNGISIGRVSKITWEISVDDSLAKATIEIAKVPVRFTGNANVEFVEREIKDETNAKSV